MCLNQFFFACVYSLAHNQIRTLLDGRRKIKISDDCLDNRWSIESSIVWRPNVYIFCVSKIFSKTFSGILLLYYILFIHLNGEKNKIYFVDILRYKRHIKHTYFFTNENYGVVWQKEIHFCPCVCYVAWNVNSPRFISIIRLWFCCDCCCL